jgi:hypothetical protein
MSPFWQNAELLPSAIRDKARETPKRSAQEYAESREKVKQGVREAGEHTKNSKQSAEVMLYIELNEDALKEKIAQEKPEDIIQNIGSYDAKQWGQMQQAFGETHFDLQVETTDEGKPQIAIQIELPDGNVSEKLQLNQSLQDALITKAKNCSANDEE